MDRDNVDKRKYDVVSISRTGSSKRTNYIQNIDAMSHQQVPAGQFVRVFSDIFLKREAGRRAYI